MALAKRFKTDSSLVEDGVWFDLEKNADGSKSRVRLRRSGRGNSRWINAYREKTANVDSDNLSVEEDEKITAEVFAEACVAEWENMILEEGQPALPFSQEAAFTLLSDPDWVDLLKDLQAKASTLSAYQKKREGEAKN